MKDLYNCKITFDVLNISGLRCVSTHKTNIRFYNNKTIEMDLCGVCDEREVYRLINYINEKGISITIHAKPENDKEILLIGCTPSSSDWKTWDYEKIEKI